MIDQQVNYFERSGDNDLLEMNLYTDSVYEWNP
jgi:hypothetical protein